MPTREQIEARLAEIEQQQEGIAKEMEQEVLLEANDQEKEDVESTNMQAAAAGMKKGFSFGSDDEIASFIQAVGDTADQSDKLFDQGLVKGLDNSLQAYKENYRKRHKEYEEVQERLEEKHPVSFNIGDVMGSAASYSLGAAPAGALGHLSKLATTGFMHGVGRSEAETLGGRLDAGMKGAQMEGAVGMVGQIASPKILGAVTEKVQEWTGDRFLTFLRGASGSAKLSKLNVQDKLKEKKMGEWATEVLTYKKADGKSVLSPLQTVDEAVESTRMALKESGEEIGNLISTSAEAIPVDGSRIHASLKRKLIDPVLNSGKQISPKRRQSLEKLSAYIDNLFYADDLLSPPTVLKSGKLVYPKKLQMADASTLQQAKVDLFDEISELKANKSFKYASHLKSLANELHSTIDSHVKKALPEKSYNSFRTAADKFKNLDKVEEALVIRSKTSNSANFATQLFLKASAYSSVGALAAHHSLGVDMPIAAGVLTGLTVLAKAPQTHAIAAKGISKLVKGLKANPEAYSKIAASIAQAATVSSDAFHEEIASGIAHVDLSEEPMERNMDALLLRKDSILTVIGAADPEMAATLDKAIRAKNDKKIGEIMGGTIGITAQMAPGIGFNGKAYTAADKQQVATWIKQNVPNARQRMKMEQKFKSDSVIPTKMINPDEEGESTTTAFETPVYQRVRDKLRNPEY